MEVYSIVQSVAKHAERTPDKVCFIDTGSTYTYSQVMELVLQLANYFHTTDLKKGDRLVAECSQDGAFLICDLACEIAGIIFVPIEKKAKPESVREILQETQAKLLVSKTEYDGIGTSMVTYADLFASAQESVSDMCDCSFPAPDDVAEILYTTGTTGKSKGVVISHRANVALAENIMYGVEMKQDNCELIILPLSHSHALRSCYANLLNGSTVDIIDGITIPKTIFEHMDNNHVTAMDLSPVAAFGLMKIAKKKMQETAEQLDYIELGTAFLSEEIKQNMLEILPGVRLYNFYGSTESGRSCVLNFAKYKDKPGCIGKPSKNANFIIVDEDKHQIDSSPNNTGLLASAGAMNMKEYYNQPELTVEVMRDGFIYTNDEAYIDEEGFVYVLGRHDDVINYKGIKISPDEIEAIIKKSPLVKDCAIVSISDKNLGEIPKLFVVPANEQCFDERELFDYMHKNIEHNKMPVQIERIDEIPRTYNGKIQRRNLIV